MASPTPYNRTYSFNDFQASNPSSPLPGTQVDNELENVEQSLNEAIDAINDVRRSDGALKNGIVTLDTLDPTVRAGVGAGALASAEAAAASADAASDSAVAAAASATAADGSATAASGYASNALTSRNEAEAEKILAQTARTGAQTARDYANQWATAAEGVDVDDGVNPIGKSSYHWAQVALGAATGALPDNSVSTTKIQDGAVTTAKIADGDVTLAKLATDVADALDSKADVQDVVIVAPQARLSLVDGVAVPESDVTGATTVYLIPSGGNVVPIYDGAQFKAASIGSGLSLPLNSNSGHTGYHQSGKNFDLFAINDGGTIRLVSGPAWSSDTSRGSGAGTTELEAVGGFFVNKNAITARYGSGSGDTVSLAARGGTYLGSFRAVANGQAADTASQRLLFNAYNPTQRRLFVGVPLATPNYNYSVAAWQSLNNLGLRAEVLLGLVGRMVSAKFVAQVANSTATIKVVKVGIGVDAATPATEGSVQATAVATSVVVAPMTFYEGTPGLGYHYLMPIEWGGGSEVQTWFTAPTSQWGRTGMVGSVTL